MPFINKSSLSVPNSNSHPFEPSREQVQQFRDRIPTRTLKSHFIHTYHNSFTGKDALTFMKNTFDLSDADCITMGSLLIKGNVIEPLNFRMNTEFNPRSKFIYSLKPYAVENLYWLCEDRDDNSPRRKSSANEDDKAFADLQSVPDLPRTLPIFGNALSVAGPMDTNRSMQILGRYLCKKYKNEMFRITLMGHKFIVVSDPDLVKIVFEDPAFGKKTETDPIFKELRCFRGEGLTTVSDGPLHAHTQSVISPCLAKQFFDSYIPTIASSMIQTFKEELANAANPKTPVDVRWFWKKATLRTVGKIAMGIDIYNGDSKWKKFSDALTYGADEAINRVFKGTKMIPPFNLQFKKAVRCMHKTIMEVVQNRRSFWERNSKDKKEYDLLDVMLTTPMREDEGRPVYMSDELIRANLTTILSAGHSTTTSMLSWTLNFLFDPNLGNTDVRYKVIGEIDALSGGDREFIPSLSDIYKHLPLMTSVLKESLRLCPPIPTIVRHCMQTTSLGGYKISKGEAVMVSCLGTHLNPKSWENPETFNPKRFAPGAPQTPYNFIPWAGGPRQCIGREFALLTGRLGFFLLLNKYLPEMSSYADVQQEEHLFVFPAGLLMNFSPRTNDFIERPIKSNSANSDPNVSNSPAPSSEPPKTWEGLKALIRKQDYQLHIVAGTNTESGNTTAVAQKLTERAIEFNFGIDEPSAPDDLLEILKSSPSTFTIVALVVSTYQGKPAKNTEALFKWLVEEAESDKPSCDLKNVNYFVFGCGNSSWAATYQKVALTIDSAMEKIGAKRICKVGLFNEAEEDLDDSFHAFYKVMAPALMHSLPEIGAARLREVDAQMSKVAGPVVKSHHANSSMMMQLLGDTSTVDATYIPSLAAAGKQIFKCKVKRIMDITPSAERSTVHIEFEMQPGMQYRAGDHLVICPEIPQSYVNRLLSHFVDYDEDSVVQWITQLGQSRRGKPTLPLNTPITLKNLLTNCLDLKAAPTKQFMANLCPLLEKSEQVDEIQAIISSPNSFKNWINDNKPISNIDVIEMFPVQTQKFSRLLEILPVLKPRPYSISSSYTLDSSSVHLSVGVVHDVFPSSNKTYQGVASYYLFSNIGVESYVNVYIEPAHDGFNIPKDDSIPIILISAGTGFAPMRSFIQERKARRAKGPIYVFFGCRSEDQDHIYDDELRIYEQEGLITGRFTAFSRSSNYPSQYVQVKIMEEKHLIWNAIHNQNAHIYVCGSATRVGAGVRKTLTDIVMEMNNCSEEAATNYLQDMAKQNRYEEDVWG